MRVIYPGSFDPVTNGHLDIIHRCSEKFDEVIIAVLSNVNKKCLFTLEERLHLLEETTKYLPNIQIDSFSGLLIEYVRKKDCTNIIRGLRAVSDLEHEMQQALANRKMYSKVETFFMVASTEVSFLSSTIVKEIASYNGTISCFVPKIVENGLKEKFKGEVK